MSEAADICGSVGSVPVSDGDLDHLPHGTGGLGLEADGSEAGVQGQLDGRQVTERDGGPDPETIGANETGDLGPRTDHLTDVGIGVGHDGVPRSLDGSARQVDARAVEPALRRIDFAPDLTEQVYERLLEAICSGELAPQTRLTQQELAASLDVSRQPVLQALRMLRKDGFVIDAGRRGLMVAPLDPRVIEQTYQVRAVLDGLAAREAASGVGSPGTRSVRCR